MKTASWEESSLAGAPSALLSLIPIAVPYCSPGNATAFSVREGQIRPAAAGV